jgi:hypothetical protein
VSARESGGLRQIIDAQRLEIPRVGEVFGPQEVTGRRNEGHQSLRVALAL